MSATLDPARYARLKDLHFELEALPLHRREARLRDIEATDPEFAAALRKRFDATPRPFDILDRAEHRHRDAAEPQLPHYRIVRELGRGGMGRVWLAERELDGATQRVALKQIAQAAWSDEDERRFQRERRILAALDHPNIAALVDGGRDAAGAPFLATAFVDGQRLDHWCAERNTSRRERVRLIRDLAAAVAYAHRTLVVHRDLKPANILVTRDGVPKLLDFGIARLLDEDAITATGPNQMTLRYAAPEQVQGERGGGVGIDIYALGVLLYELLADASPYGKTDGTAALVRAILDTQPPAPTRATGTGDADLDAVCLKALRKRPEDRYANADALLADLDRWLGGEPVEARRGERGYRLRAFLRRHWLGVTVAGAVMIGAIGFVTFHVAALDRQLAETARERDKAKAVASYFQELFASAAPSATRDGDLTAKELLARSVERLEQGDTTGMDDDARASMFHAAGRIMAQQGLADAAARMFDRSLALWLAQPQVPENDVADAYNERARLFFGRGEYQDALAMTEAALARRDAMADFSSIQRGVLTQQKSVTLRSLGRNAEATAALEQAVAVLARQLPESRANHASALGNLGTFLVMEGRVEEGHAKLRESLRELARLKPERTTAKLAISRNYAMSLRELGRFADADRAYAALLTDQRRFYGDQHIEVARTLHSLAQTRMVEQRWDEAENALDQAEAVEHALGNDQDPRLLAYQADRARIRIARQQFQAAVDLLAPVLAERGRGVHSERSFVDAERAALAYAQCRLAPTPELADRIRDAVAAMQRTPPLPRMLVPQAESWARDCAGT
jgi:tetratricopeptide (TPR) repeat protein/predicted Ser/Thr protein kinase